MTSDLDPGGRFDPDEALPPDQDVQVLNVYPGKAFGLRQPTYLARCQLATFGWVDWAAIDGLIEACMPAGSEVEFDSRTRDEAPLFGRIGAWTVAVQLRAGLPVFEEPRLLLRKGGPAWVSGLLAVPFAPGRFQAGLASLRWAVACAALLTAEPDASSTRRSVIVDLTERLLRRLRAATPKNINTLRFLKAAHDRDTPWDLATGNVYQFGWGAKSRLMEGAFTDASGSIAVRFARNKEATAAILRRVGLPAPEHRLAVSPEAAVDAAAQLGFPVVVKPADRDRGIGVATNLLTPEQVRAAYVAAASHSKRILVEKHHFGQDYRLLVFNGALVWTVLRQPGGVTGDGVHTVATLIDWLNADPRRREGPRSVLKRLEPDEEASELLSLSGMTMDSVPPSGRFVRLRRAANVSTGGTPLAVNDQVHPDNKQLAIDVADAVRLDLVGIDLLIEDIARSWHKVGAVICEVNGDPQLGFTTQQHLYGDILGTLCGGTGRIPIVVLIGSRRARRIAKAASDDLLARGHRTGTASSGEVAIAGRPLIAEATDVFVASQMLIANRAVELAFVVIDDASALDTSLPFDRVDLLLVVEAMSTPDALTRLVRMLAPNSAAVIANEDETACCRAVADVPRAKLRFLPGRDEVLASAMIEAVAPPSPVETP